MTLLAIGISGYALINVAIPQFLPEFVANIFELSPLASYLHFDFGMMAIAWSGYSEDSHFYSLAAKKADLSTVLKSSLTFNQQVR
jgi:hypothetical protein